MKKNLKAICSFLICFALGTPFLQARDIAIKLELTNARRQICVENNFVVLRRHLQPGHVYQINGQRALPRATSIRVAGKNNHAFIEGFKFLANPKEGGLLRVTGRSVGKDTFQARWVEIKDFKAEERLHSLTAHFIKNFEIEVVACKKRRDLMRVHMFNRQQRDREQDRQLIREKIVRDTSDILTPTQSTKLAAFFVSRG